MGGHEVTMQARPAKTTEPKRLDRVEHAADGGRHDLRHLDRHRWPLPGTFVSAPRRASHHRFPGVVHAPHLLQVGTGDATGRRGREREWAAVGTIAAPAPPGDGGCRRLRTGRRRRSSFRCSRLRRRRCTMSAWPAGSARPAAHWRKWPRRRTARHRLGARAGRRLGSRPLRAWRPRREADDIAPERRDRSRPMAVGRCARSGWPAPSSAQQGGPPMS